MPRTQGPEPILRLERPADAEAIVRLLRAAFEGPDEAAIVERIAALPAGYVHLWRDGEIIGQMEMRLRDEPPIGYVNLFYLMEREISPAAQVPSSKKGR